MPMPTPPKPGEEPRDESELYRYHLRRLITWYLEALDPLPAEAFAWRPPTPETNSLAAICSHAISSAEWWVLSCVGDGPIERDRDAEFAVTVELGRDAPALRGVPGTRRGFARGYGLRATRRDQPASRWRPHEPPLPAAHRRASGAAPGACRGHDRLVSRDNRGGQHVDNASYLEPHDRVTRHYNLSSGKVTQRARRTWHHDGDTSAQARPRMRVA